MGTYVTSGEISFFMAALTSTISLIDFSFCAQKQKQLSNSKSSTVLVAIPCENQVV